MSIEKDHKLDELAAREAQAKEMGSQRRLMSLREQGKLNARERIAQLLDRDSFAERGLLSHSDLEAVRDKTPADGKITGFGEIDGRTVFVSADDVSVMAGAGGRIGVSKQYEWAGYATEKGVSLYPFGRCGWGAAARYYGLLWDDEYDLPGYGEAA